MGMDIQEHQRMGEASRNSQSSTTSSPPSSPSHEFSFTISLNPSSAGSNKTNSFAIDLSPADEIFFHGHLLPLHLISHIPITSPNCCSNSNSLETFNVLVTDVSNDHNLHDDSSANTSATTGSNGCRGKGRIKMKSLFAKWKKGSEVCDRKEEKKNKAKFELAQLIKKYVRRFVKPTSLFDRENRRLQRRSHSFIVNKCPEAKQEYLEKRSGVSAPATMQTSPANSGNNLPTETAVPSKTECSMDELHTAIQAAIAHCKTSVQVKNAY